jgi:Rieske 2Fe-2S family protein
MGGQSGFDRSEYGLHPVRVESGAGFVWVNLAPEGPSLGEAMRPFFDKFARFPLDRMRRGARQEYDVDANWKILVENFSECYHCAPVHPSLNRLTPYQSGNNDAWLRHGPTAGRFAGGFMEFAGDFQSMTRTGYTSRPPLPGMSAIDRRRIYYYVLFPNSFFSLHPDYLMVHHVQPVTPSRSHVENEFYFAPEAMADPGFDPRDAVEIWDEINRQDWQVCELVQQGIASRSWTGGRYSDAEEMVRDFDEFLSVEFDHRRENHRPSAPPTLP